MMIRSSRRLGFSFALAAALLLPGSAPAELAIEGMEHYAAVRDFLYGKMRGTGTGAKASARAATNPAGVGNDAEIVALLRGIKDDVEGVRSALESRGEER